MAEPILVGMRLRPLVNHEIGQAQCLKIEGNREVSIVEDAIDTDRKVAAVTSDFDRKSTFAFDVAMDSTNEASPDFVSQEKCYDIMGRRMVQHMLKGFNTCLFCYGQTGTGKTTTIMGKAQPKSERGLLMRLVDDVFEEVDKEQLSGSQVHIVMQMLEVYNEKLNDLLAASDYGPGGGTRKKINIHVHPELGVYLTGATEAPVKSAAECIKTIEYGNAMKVVHATAMNAQSSRGHTVFKLNVFREGGKDNLSTTSEVCFADLAGRENEKTTQVTGERLVELGFINKSLLYLSGCIQSLGQPSHSKRRQTISGPGDAMKPRSADMSKFRNSKLTLLLSNALSGNSRTSMIGTLSPAAAHFEESHNTLRFASTVKTIKVQAKAAQAVDKDSLVKQLQKEVQQLKRQLEQAREKHDDEDISAISVQLEATTAIVAAQTRDWTHFQRESAELSKKRTKTMESLMAYSSSQVGETPLPYLANYSEDPHLAFRLVMHVAADGDEHSLGSGPSCSFRLPPSLGVCDITGYIRNEGGRLMLRPAALPHSIRDQRPASIEVNGDKLSLEAVELKHLDRVLFGHSTIFYAFLQKVSPEELSAKLRAPNEFDKEEWEGGFTQKAMNSILGEDRSNDLEQELARRYFNQLQSQNRDSQGIFMLRAFMQRAKRARMKVDEANDLTNKVRPKSGLHFELASQAPVLSYGFARHANLPELCVRLVRRMSPLQRFRRAAWKLMAAKGMRIKDAVESVLPSKPNDSAPELLSTWAWTKFLSRLEMMHEVRESWLADPDNFLLDPAKDPWAEYGPSEIEQLREDHARRIQELRERAQNREEEIREAIEAAYGRESQAVRSEALAKAELRGCREELEAARAELSRQRNDEVIKPVVEAKSECLRRSLAAPGGLRMALDATDAEGRVSRCLELARANKALLESLCLEQRESLLEPSLASK